MDKQFEKTYSLIPNFIDNPGNLKKQYFIEDEQIRMQQALSQRPSNIRFFEKIMYARDFVKKEKPRVGFFCNMIPQEIIMAIGAEPVRLDCGNSAAAVVGEEILSGEICPLAKASFGMFMHKESLANTCDLLILPTSCDAKRKMGEVLNDFKPTFMFNLPPEQNHSRYSKHGYLETLRLIKFLETHLKVKLSARNLRTAIKLGQQRTLFVRELQNFRAAKPKVLSVCDLFLIIQSSLFRPVHLDQWMEETNSVLNEIKQFESERKSLRPRLVLTGAPMIWPNYKVVRIFEESGADIITDTLSTGVQSCFDPVVKNEGGKSALLRAIVNRYMFASICPCFISQTTRLNRILDLFNNYRAHGVVSYSLRLCQLFDMENYRIERTIKARKIPHINIRTDYSLEDTEQLRVRIEAFLETL